MSSSDPKHLSNRWERWLLALFLAVAVVRAACFLAYAAYALGSRGQVFVLEGANVHFCWRVQQGLPWYPAGNGFPYDVSYMGPVYFAMVGTLGWLFDLPVMQLYLVGRWVSVAATLATLALLGWFVCRRGGRGAALAAVACGLGPAVAFPFAVMVRPDALAGGLNAHAFGYDSGCYGWRR